MNGIEGLLTRPKKTEEEKQETLDKYELKRKFIVLQEANIRLRTKYKELAGKEFEG